MDVWAEEERWYLARSLDRGAGLLVITARKSADGGPMPPVECFIAEGSLDSDELVLRPLR